jgi:hypothetical protein
VGKTVELTNDLTEQIADLIQDGNYPKTVAVHCGISVSQFNRWMDEGNRLQLHLESGLPTDHWTPEEWTLFNFAYQVNLAYANAEIYHLQLAKAMAQAGKSTWTMPFTWLERCRPGWQRRERMDDGNKSVDEELVGLSKQFAEFDRKRKDRL